MSVTASDMVPHTSRYFVTKEPHHDSPTLLGFWLYLMSDAFIFGALFACYAVYGTHYAGGPTGADLFELPSLAVETGALLLSSITYGFAMLAAQRNSMRAVMAWLAVTAAFGMVFLGLEITEFIGLVSDGAGPDTSAFLSSFFSLVGTHGLHVTFGTIWIFTLMTQVKKHGLTPDNLRRLSCLSMFWHFLDLVWIGVFSFVYLIGVLH